MKRNAGLTLKKNKKKWIFPFFSLILAVSLFGCTSYLSKDISDFTGLLPGNNSLYLEADREREPELVNYFLNKFASLDGQSEKILEKTTRIYAGLRSSNSDAISFDMLATGKFPRNSANCAFSLRKEWVKIDMPLRAWQNIISGMQICVPSNDLLFVSSEHIDTIINNFRDRKTNTAIPQYEKDAMNNSLFSIFMPEVNRDVLSEITLGSEKELIKSILLYINRQKERYSLTMEITLNTEKQIKGMKSVIRTFLLGIIRKFGNEEVTLFRDTVRLEDIGLKVVCSGINLRPDHLQLFINDFLFRKGDEK